MIIGVDLAPIKPLPNVITFQSDITTEHCRSQLRGHMKTWKADAVLHDGAPNVGMAWTQDAFTQSELVLQSLKLAVEFLTQGGTFVTKVFRSKDYNNLMWVFQQFFDKVEATKPPSSRNVSAEIFVVCRGFKAPKRFDPKLLDPKHVFEDLQESTPNYQAKIFNPEKKTRKRDGYEEGDYTQFHEMSALDFVKSMDPVQCLGSTNVFTFNYKEEPELKQLRRSLPQTTPELLECFKDLKVLGKKDFRLILKWRLAARELLGLDKKEGDEEPDGEVEVETLDEEEQIDKDLEDMRQRELAKKKRLRRQANEKKQKEITRMQLNMTTPVELGFQSDQVLFNLKNAERTGKLNDLAKGKKALVFSQDEEKGQGEPKYKEIVLGTDDAIEDLDDQLDNMYQQYKQRKAERDSKYEAKRLRDTTNDEWTGFDNQMNDTDDSSVAGDDSDSESDSEINQQVNQLISSLAPKEAGGDKLTRKAAIFFDNPLFDGLENVQENENGEIKSLNNDNVMDIDNKDDDVPSLGSNESSTLSASSAPVTSDSEFESDIEVVANNHDSDNNSDDEWDSANAKEKETYVDIATAQAMTLAHQLALGQKSKQDLIDDGFNKYAFRDKEGLPEWFLDDENQHSKIMKPITKEAAEAIKAKLRTMNARPMKKVAEAKARKKYKAVKKLEKLKKKFDLINDDGSRSEQDKSEEIAKLMKKASKKQAQKPKVKVIAAKGANKGLKGRPKGVKGKYKMVDGTMKKEQRALNRLKKKKK